MAISDATALTGFATVVLTVGAFLLTGNAYPTIDRANDEGYAAAAIQRSRVLMLAATLFLLSFVTLAIFVVGLRMLLTAQGRGYDFVATAAVVLAVAAIGSGTAGLGFMWAAIYRASDSPVDKTRSALDAFIFLNNASGATACRRRDPVRRGDRRDGVPSQWPG